MAIDLGIVEWIESHPLLAMVFFAVVYCIVMAAMPDPEPPEDYYGPREDYAAGAGPGAGPAGAGGCGHRGPR